MLTDLSVPAHALYPTFLSLSLSVSVADFIFAARLTFNFLSAPKIIPDKLKIVFKYLFI